MNFWRFVQKTGSEPAAGEAGRTLGECHRLLLGYSGELPRLGIVEEALQVLEGMAGVFGSDTGMLRRHLETGLGLDGEFQALHGDAHPGNLLSTTGGVLWTDWEDSFLGPVEWDLSSLLWNARYLELSDDERYAGTQWIVGSFPLHIAIRGESWDGKGRPTLSI